jgi:hypothetical protein
VSLSTRKTGNQVARTVISKLGVWDITLELAAWLQPGAILDGYRIRRTVTTAGGSGDVYLMEFESVGHRYQCPLVAFQSRTRRIDSISPDQTSAPGAPVVWNASSETAPDHLEPR